MMLIDSHTHVFSKNVVLNKNIYLSDPHFNLLYASEKSKIKNAQELNDYGEISQIDSLWAMGFPWQDSFLCSRENESILSESSTYKRVIPFAGIPALPQADIKKTIREISANGFKGIGEIAFYSTQDEDIFRYCHNIFEAAEEEGLVVCFHLNEPVGHRYPGKTLADFDKIYTLVSAFPSLRIVFAHLGGGILFYELMPEVKSVFKNVYYDTAASPYIYDPIVYLRVCDIVGSRKILFGSDFPLLGIDRYEESIRSYLPIEDAEMVMGKNAVKILSGGK